MRRPRLTPKVLDGLGTMAGAIDCDMAYWHHDHPDAVPSLEAAIRYIRQLQRWQNAKTASRRR